ncbi:MAG: ABC transporter ATP-binding protein, partial [Porcipelethomonas sp.]
MECIKVDNLTKDYGHGRGIFSVSFNVSQGEVFGFLGPNGAGKTTTIRHLMGFSKPQKGSARILGMRCDRKSSQILANVGYLPGEVALPESLTGWEFIRMMQELRHCYNKDYLDYLIDKFQVDLKGKTKHMSLGNKRKLAIVTAFMANPDILILDEPTSGLDPVMQETFIDFMHEEKKQGKTILLSSHMFSEVDAVCDRITIIRDGKIVSTIDADEIRHNENKTYQVSFFSAKEAYAFTKALIPMECHAETAAETVSVSVNDSNIGQLLNVLSNYRVKCFKEVQFTLRDYFMHFYQKEPA